MIEHLVLFKFEKLTKNEQDLLEAISGLKAKIKDETGRDLIIDTQIVTHLTPQDNLHHGFAQGVRMFFRNLEDLQKYDVHPEHQKVVDRIISMGLLPDGTFVFDMELTDE